MNRILVIEDDNLLRLNIVELLKEEGFEVYQAENGKTGIIMAKKILPDLILSDILMPEADGFEVLKELQKDLTTASLPFIFLTAQGDSTNVRMGMREGADDYLIKPYKAADLLDAVNSRLNKKRKIDMKTGEILKSISTTLPHEFRTPLVAVIGYSSLISEDFHLMGKNEIIEMVKSINLAGIELLALIEKFLTYSELETILFNKEKIIRYNSYKTDSVTNSLSTTAIKLAAKYDRESDLSLSMQSCSVNIHKDHFDLLVREILENAFKFSPKGTPVEILSRIDGNKMLLSFTDSGKGLSHEHIKEIGVLRQFDKAAGGNNGVGLGLAIAMKIAGLYGLHIEFLSGQKFTKVIITFPLNGEISRDCKHETGNK